MFYKDNSFITCISYIIKSSKNVNVKISPCILMVNVGLLVFNIFMGDVSLLIYYNTTRVQ